MKRRDFLKTTVAGGPTLGTPFVARAQQALPEVINVGHLVGICMSPLFFAHAAGLLQGRRPQRPAQVHAQSRRRASPRWSSNAMDVIHNPFTNAFVAAAQASAPIRIIAGSGAGGLFIIAQKESGIRSMADLAAAKGKGLKIGTIRFNTFELTLYRDLVRNNVAYSDYNIVWFNDTLSMAAAFEAKALDVVTHVEPFATRLVDQLGGVRAREQPRRLGSARPRLRDQHLGALPRAPSRGAAALHQGAPARRRRHQGRHAEGGRGARRRQVLPRRQGHARPPRCRGRRRRSTSARAATRAWRSRSTTW